MNVIGVIRESRTNRSTINVLQILCWMSGGKASRLFCHPKVADYLFDPGSVAPVRLRFGGGTVRVVPGFSSGSSGQRASLLEREGARQNISTDFPQKFAPIKSEHPCDFCGRRSLLRLFRKDFWN